MNRPLKVLQGIPAAIRERIASQSERTLLLGTVLVVSAISAAVAYLLTQLFAVDVVASLLNVSKDCWLSWGMGIGQHCFSDYSMIVGVGLQPNPWSYETSLPWGNYEPHATGGPATAMLPHMLFGFPAHMLGVPTLGLLGYLLALTAAVIAPAIWAAKGAYGLERIVIFVVLGVAAIPVWAVIDRGNSAGFIVPAALGFLIALRRRQWRLAALMVVLATLVKPWFFVLVFALFASRQWRIGSFAIIGVVVSNVAAYLLWPRDFPRTIPQSVENLFHAGSSFQDLVSLRNVSFGRAFALLPDTFDFIRTGGKMTDGFLAGPRSLFGYVVMVVIVGAVLVLGRRIPPVMAGIVLLATATLFPPLAYYYYLVFVLPIAAIIVRDPNGPRGSGVFDKLALESGRRPVVGLVVSLATALSIAQIAVPGPVVNAPIFGQLGERGVIDTTPVVFITTTVVTPFLWLLACAVILVSYARKPARSDEGAEVLSRESSTDTDVSVSSGHSMLIPGTTEKGQP